VESGHGGSAGFGGSEFADENERRGEHEGGGDSTGQHEPENRVEIGVSDGHENDSVEEAAGEHHFEFVEVPGEASGWRGEESEREKEQGHNETDGFGGGLELGAEVERHGRDDETDGEAIDEGEGVGNQEKFLGFEGIENFAGREAVAAAVGVAEKEKGKAAERGHEESAEKENGER